MTLFSCLVLKHIAQLLLASTRRLVVMMNNNLLSSEDFYVHSLHNMLTIFILLLYLLSFHTVSQFYTSLLLQCISKLNGDAVES